MSEPTAIGEVGARLRALVARIRNDHARFKIVPGGSDVVLATTADEWADELDALLSAPVVMDTKLDDAMTKLQRGVRWPCKPHAHLTEKEAVECERLSAPVGSPPPLEKL